MAPRDENKDYSETSDLFSIVLIACSGVLFLSLFSYSPDDVLFLNSTPQTPLYNFCGKIGSYGSYFLFFYFGLGAFAVPLFLLYAGITKIFRPEYRFCWSKVGFFLIELVALTVLFELFSVFESLGSHQYNLVGPGGIVGTYLTHSICIQYCGRIGTTVLVLSIVFANIVLITELQLLPIFYFLKDCISQGSVSLWEYVRGKFGSFDEEEDDDDGIVHRRRKVKIKDHLREREAAAKKSKTSKHRKQTKEDRVAARAKERSRSKKEVQDKKIKLAGLKSPLTSKKKVITDHLAQMKKFPKQAYGPAPQPFSLKINEASMMSYHLPRPQLLKDPRPLKGIPSKHDLDKKARILETTLDNFNVEAQVTGIVRGPVITRYEVQPAPGVKVQRITSLSDDIALALKAASVRIVAPIPGKSAVGIEVPNSVSVLVTLKELLMDEVYRKGGLDLPLALGKSISGASIVEDLTSMPHLLIAGATGSGKSVCVNSILLSLLFSLPPHKLKFLLIDPKKVELGVYEGLPHLIDKVVTDPRKAASALGWVIREMEYRYDLLAEQGVRNIRSYNRQFGEKTSMMSKKGREIHPLPLIVIVIDELADLMVVARPEVETTIQRISQLARAVGIHMILATQRPSVDVVTGVIKANFPARIAFQVASAVDSKTILGVGGAQKLLGQGDMLYLSAGGMKPIRAQGAFVDEKDVASVVGFIKDQFKGIKETVEKKPSVLDDFSKQQTRLVQRKKDPLYGQAVDIVLRAKRPSATFLQTTMGIGYPKAAKFINMMEEEGIVGPPQGSKGRKILVDSEQYDPDAAQEEISVTNE